MRVAIAHWRRPAYFSGWTSINAGSGLQPEVCVTAGFVVQDAEDRVVLASSRSAGGEVAGLVCVPKGALLRPLEEVRVNGSGQGDGSKLEHLPERDLEVEGLS